MKYLLILLALSSCAKSSGTDAVSVTPAPSTAISNNVMPKDCYDSNTTKIINGELNEVYACVDLSTETVCEIDKSPEGLLSHCESIADPSGSLGGL